MLQRLKALEKKNTPIRVGLVGAGAMGLGIAYQLSITPGMELVWVADSCLGAAEKAADVYGEEIRFGENVQELLEKSPVDVFVESTNSIYEAYEYCVSAIDSGAHVVLMNAEVDLVFGRHLKKRADAQGVVVTSDAGDQHGVLAKMIEEIELWGFKIVQAGNIKGYHRRDATICSLLIEAEKRNLNPVQCCAYTDGTKLNIEMALLSNAYGYLPAKQGMRGLKLESVEQVLEAFDFKNSHSSGEVEYILGAEPGGGVYIVAHTESEVQSPYLSYYKLGDGPYYLFYRPYHLCHLETPQAIAKAYFDQEGLLQPWAGHIADVYAFAKRDLKKGEEILHGIGDDLVYGEIQATEVGETSQWLPIGLLNSPGKVVLKSDVACDQALCWSDVTWEDERMVEAYRSL